MDHPKYHSLFGLGRPGYIYIYVCVCVSVSSQFPATKPSHHRRFSSDREPWTLLSSTAKSALQRSHKQPEPRHGKSFSTWRNARVVNMSFSVVRYTVYKYITVWIHVDMKI